MGRVAPDRQQAPPDCCRCGRCCMGPGGAPDPYAEDLRLWAERGQPEIAATLAAAQGRRCPYLTDGSGYRCAIYPLRPLVCRHFARGGSACLELRFRAGLGPEGTD